MIVKAENHLLHRPMNNFAVPQTYGGGLVKLLAEFITCMG